MAEDAPANPAGTTPGQGGRVPGVAAVLSAALASAPVFFFDELEVVFGGMFGAGPASFLGLIAVFGLVWLLLALPLLAVLAPKPAREGLAAGGLVGLVMLWFLFGDGPPAVQVPLRLFLWVPFGSLAVGFGAGTGLVAQRLRGAPAVGGRAAAFAALGAMLLMAAVSAVFLGPAGGPFGWAVLVIVVVVAGGAVAWLATDARRHGRTD